MTAFDAATEAYIARLLDEAPPLDSEQAALVVRTFGPRQLGLKNDQRAQAPPPAPPKKVALYRHYDSAGQLLYIGITENVVSRTYAHNRRSRWAEFAVRAEVEWHGTRAEATRAERRAIDEEQPLFNSMHAVPSRDGRLVEYLVSHGRWDLIKPGL